MALDPYPSKEIGQSEGGQVDVDSVQSIESDIFYDRGGGGHTKGGRDLARSKTFFGGGAIARWRPGGVAKIDFIS